MATKNIEININTGSSYDVLYPKANLGNITGSLPISSTTGNLPLTRTSGTLPVEKGGTGATTLNDAIQKLCYSSSTVSTLNDNYYFGCANSSTGGGVKLSTLVNYIKNSGGGDSASIQYGSYLPTIDGEMITIFYTKGRTNPKILILSNDDEYEAYGKDSKYRAGANVIIRMSDDPNSSQRIRYLIYGNYSSLANELLISRRTLVCDKYANYLKLDFGTGAKAFYSLNSSISLYDSTTWTPLSSEKGMVNYALIF